MILLKRLPTFEQIKQVYAVIVAILYSWSVFTTIDNSWVLFFNIIDILNLFAYIFAAAFLESLIIIGVLLLISLFFSKTLLDNRFVIYGTVLTITFLGSIIYLYSQTWTIGILDYIDQWIIFFCVITFITLFLTKKLKFVQRIIMTFADMCITFLYIFLPISAISIVYVFIRNLS